MHVPIGRPIIMHIIRLADGRGNPMVWAASVKTA